jgi:hypothetical protein
LRFPIIILQKDTACFVDRVGIRAMTRKMDDAGFMFQHRTLQILRLKSEFCFQTIIDRPFLQTLGNAHEFFIQL